MMPLPEFGQERRPESAIEEYERRKTAIIGKLYTLAERVQAHGANERVDWRHVGDLGHVDGQLQELLEFLTTSHRRVD